jgi:hypothetical protein
MDPDTSVQKKVVCQDVAKNLCEKFKDFVSPSRKPHKPRFNRDNLIEFVSTLEIDFNKFDIQSRIVTEFIKLNREDAKQYVIKNNIKFNDKCKDFDFYLFYLDYNSIKRKIEEALNN